METINNFYVYKHTSPSGKCYIGITCQDLDYRWGNNGYKYTEIKRDGKFKHPYFANAILKYGWDNFKHEIIHTNLSKEEARNKEKEYIAYYKLGGKSYNITDGGDGIWGYKFTDKQKRKNSEAHKGLKQSPETVAKRVAKNTGKIRTKEQKAKTSKPVILYTKNLEFITEYFGIREASRSTGINNAHIGDCCNHKANRKSAGGYVWAFKGEEPQNPKKDHHSKKKINQYNINGDLIKTWESMKDIINTYNISRYKLLNFCKSKSPDENGNIWKFV